jgi:pSer/pThr/pTyr-binding forkhead associated (FHA) protein
MSIRKENSDQTRIGSQPKATERIPERYQASVVITEGYAAGMEYLVTRSSTVIGRDANADIPLKDPLVSRQHAIIVYHEGHYVLKDLESTNGTRMKDTLIKQADLRHGDRFRVGDTVLQFILEENRRARTYEIGT